MERGVDGKPGQGSRGKSLFGVRADVSEQGSDAVIVQINENAGKGKKPESGKRLVFYFPQAAEDEFGGGHWFSP